MAGPAASAIATISRALRADGLMAAATVMLVVLAARHRQRIDALSPREGALQRMA
jgi:hypothetical protein